MALMVTFYYVEKTSTLCFPNEISEKCVTSWLNTGLTGAIAWPLLHVIIHIDNVHLGANLVGVAIAMTLVESWMTLIPRRGRYLILLFAYGVSVVWELLYAWTVSSWAGASFMVFELLPITWAYYVIFASKINFKGLVHLAPIGIGYILSVILFSLIVDVSTGNLWKDSETFLHLIGVLYGLIFVLGFKFKRLSENPTYVHNSHFL